MSLEKKVMKVRESVSPRSKEQGLKRNAFLIPALCDINRLESHSSSSLKTRLSGLFNVKMGLLILASNAGCTEENYSITLGGVKVSEAFTNSDGEATLVETILAPGQEEKEVEVEVTAFDKPVENASVLYFDNVFSEGFFISSEGHAPQLYISLHNSDHTYSLTPAPLQILHDSFQKEQSKPGAETFFSWAEANWDYTGCLNRDNMRTLMKPGAFLIKRLGIIETFGIASLLIKNAPGF